MKQKFNQGFTLIELLVVIAIIGILSAVVLSQLNSAREKGRDATIKSQMRNLINRGILYYETNGESYVGVCTDTRFQAMYTAAGGACNHAAAGYRVRAQLAVQNQFSGSSGVDWLCVDATGIIKILDTDPGGTATTCP